MPQTYIIKISEQQRELISKVLNNFGDEASIKLNMDADDEEFEAIMEEMDTLRDMFADMPDVEAESPGLIHDLQDEGPTVAGWQQLRKEVAEQHPDYPRDEPVDALDASLPAIGSDY